MIPSLPTPTRSVLRHNLATAAVVREQLATHGLHGRALKDRQRSQGAPIRCVRRKVLWGDLADHHLVYAFSAADDQFVKYLRLHFDAIYLDQRRLGLSVGVPFVDAGDLEVKYTRMARFGEVIRSIPMEVRLEHFLNDGDSPDIPIPIYVGYLNQIREMARAQR
jgi:hypothetical protein